MGAWWERAANLLGELRWALDELQQRIGRALGERLSESEAKRLLGAMGKTLGQIRGDALEKLDRTLTELQSFVLESRLGQVAARLADLYFYSSSSQEFLERAADLLLAETRSERLLLVLYPGGLRVGGEVGVDSTRVLLACARNFQSGDLSAEEHTFSRTLLWRALSSGETLLVRDALSEPAYSQETSVIQRGVRSVLVAPFAIGGISFGAIYVENNSTAAAYSESDREFLARAARLIAVYLEAADRLHTALALRKESAPEVASEIVEGLVGTHAAWRKVVQTVLQVAPSSATVLIEGESGTGKELLARAIHALSPRAGGPFIVVNCAALPETLAESELFGHERGAFTGAVERRLGRFERAHRGTIFLDEIGELPLSVQAKLLRFLQFHEFERLGGGKSIRVDVRVIAATSRQLAQMVSEGKFLEALYYRLNVIPLRVPPLRERPEDIPLLALHFLKKYAPAAGRPTLRFHPETLLALQEYPFPGNVRELENLVQHLVLLAPSEEIRVEDLPEAFLNRRRALEVEKNPFRAFLRTAPVDREDLERRRRAILKIAQAYIDELEDALIQRALERARGNIAEAARLSGLHRSIFYRKGRRSSGTPASDPEQFSSGSA
ncbi:MAG: sigma-54-dependent Fis family transcriptional regulator [Blastocatellia bacterium]|nr:sigma-54-dependent Fis family transcriptional regulator [Blastocatellia bacterium]MDW8257420.1 sigma-54-dependent Fis family transcriptional regulator [Acidobacteriota bacterium]